MSELAQGLVFAYVEFNPSWIYYGWWFYVAPIVDGKVARDKSGWLNKMDWKMDNLMAALGLPQLGGYRYDNGPKSVDAFLERYPNGAVLLTDGRRFEVPVDCDLEPWRCLKAMREAQLKGFAEEAAKDEVAP